MNRLVKFSLKAFAVLALGSMASFGFGQDPAPAAKPLSVRARFVRLDGENRFIVRTQENKEVTFFVAPGTRYVVNGKAVRLADLKPGADLTTTYTLNNNQQIANVVTVGEASPDNTAFRGVVTAKTAETITVKAQTGKEMAFNVNAKSRYLLRDKAVTINDIKIGAVVEVRYVDRDSHSWVEELIINDVTAGTTDEPGEEYKGVVVRFVGQNQVVIKTADNKEVTVDITPQTTYLLNNQPARVADFPAGAEVRVQYNLRDRRPIARSILGVRRVDR